MTPAPGEPHDAEHGFTLQEVVVAVALMLLIGGTAFESLRQRPAQTRSAAVAFAAFVDEARSLAATNDDAAFDGGGGASVGVIRDGSDYVVTMYRYRPALGARVKPQRLPNTPSLRTNTAIALATDGGIVQPPFALFFSASGHAAAQPAFDIRTSPPMATEPACPATTGIIIAFGEDPHIQTHALSCELARLDLDSPVSPATPAAAQPRRFP